MNSTTTSPSVDAAQLHSRVEEAATQIQQSFRGRFFNKHLKRSGGTNTDSTTSDEAANTSQSDSSKGKTSDESNAHDLKGGDNEEQQTNEEEEENEKKDLTSMILLAIFTVSLTLSKFIRRCLNCKSPEEDIATEAVDAIAIDGGEALVGGTGQGAGPPPPGGPNAQAPP